LHQLTASSYNFSDEIEMRKSMLLLSLLLNDFAIFWHICENPKNTILNVINPLIYSEQRVQPT